MTANRPARPSVIVSASGMATGGRVLHHLRHLLPDPRNTVLIVGFAAEGTRARDLAEGARTIKIHGEYVPVRAEIIQADAFSAHADANDILSWLAGAPEPAATYVVHGEPSAAAALRDRLDHELGWTAVVPALGERVTIRARKLRRCSSHLTVTERNEEPKSLLENSAEVRRSRGTRVWRRRWRTHRVHVSGRLFRTRGMGSGCLAAISVPPRLQSLPTCRGTAFP
jgi:hypothetical protein